MICISNWHCKLNSTFPISKIYETLLDFDNENWYKNVLIIN